MITPEYTYIPEQTDLRDCEKCKEPIYSEMYEVCIKWNDLPNEVDHTGIWLCQSCSTLVNPPT